MKYTKEYTVKEWKRFDRIAERENDIDITMQEVLLKKYEIILTDYKTKKEKIKHILNKFNAENLNKGITKFNKGIDQFSKIVAAKPTSKRKSSSFGMSQREYDNLFGKHRKVKGNTVNFWGEDHKTRNKKKKRDDTQISFYGSKKVKFF